MADQNKLAPSSMNMLRFLMMNNGMGQGGIVQDEESAKDMLAKQAYYRDLFGAQAQGNQQQNPFMGRGEAQLYNDPRVNLEMMAPQSRFVEGLGFQTPPPSLGGRLSAETGVGDGQFRAGVQTMAVQFPDGTIRMMPRNFDAGYKMPLMGGTLDVGGNVMPKEGFMPQTMWGANLKYSKKF